MYNNCRLWLYVVHLRIYTTSLQNSIHPLRVVAIPNRFFFRLHTSTAQNIKETHFQPTTSFYSYMPICIYLYAIAVYLLLFRFVIYVGMINARYLQSLLKGKFEEFYCIMVHFDLWLFVSGILS